MDGDGIIHSNSDKAVDCFDEMELKQELLRGIHTYVFEKPFAIQQRAIIPCVKGHDVIAQSQPGTGKTATCLISILQRIDPSSNECQALILAHHRELALRTQKEVLALGNFLENLKCHACIGGTNIREDMRCLEEGAQVVVGTPGRVHDMIFRKSLKIDHIKVFVVDDADEMFADGFNEQVHKVFQRLPQDVRVQFIFFATNLPQVVLKVSEQFMRNPVQVLVNKEELNLDESVKQFYLFVEKNEGKLDALCDLYDTLSITQAVIFCNNRRNVDLLADTMTKKDYNVLSMHGHMNQKEKEERMKNLRTGSSSVLICTDSFARVMDVQQFSLVINYDLPPKHENYIRRIVRGGRFGRKSVVINFVTTEDKRKLSDIEQFYNTRITEMPKTVADLLLHYLVKF
ncbi:uncharacterized protein LOC135848183 [Planococcus citri]|uniref:uncharacterized protein LOC135848183 n=1 Tax=Planococcus citri TaxID=170843 RepID=UPI0031F8B7CA